MLWLSIGFAGLFITKLIRSLIQTDKKPIACDVCMSFWSSLLGLLGFIQLEIWASSAAWRFVPYSAFWNVLPAAGVVFALLKIIDALSPKLKDLSFLTDKQD